MIRLAVLNHLLGQRADLRGELMRHAGRHAAIEVVPLRLHFMVAADGYLSSCERNAPTDASLQLSPWLLPRLAMGDPTAEREVRMGGDAALAHDLARVLQSLNWDAEHDLARLLGDLPAHRLAESARNWIGDPRQLARNLAESSAEYLQEEIRLLASRPEVEGFVAEVDRLRDDLARLEKRLAALEHCTAKEEAQ